MAPNQHPAAAEREGAKLQVERMPLALCCDDPSEVRWRTACAGRRLWPLRWDSADSDSPRTAEEGMSAHTPSA